MSRLQARYAASRPILSERSKCCASRGRNFSTTASAEFLDVTHPTWWEDLYLGRYRASLFHCLYRVANSSYVAKVVAHTAVAGIMVDVATLAAVDDDIVAAARLVAARLVVAAKLDVVDRGLVLRIVDYVLVLRIAEYYH